MIVVGSLCLALAVGAAAQVRPEEVPILEAYQKLASEPEFMLEIHGSDVYKGVVTSYESFAYWKNDPSLNPPAPKLEIRTYRNGATIPDQRILADGRNLFVYNVVRKEYSTYNYMDPDGRTSNPVSKMIGIANSSASEQSKYVTRFLTDLLNPAGATYRSWMPGFVPQPLPDGSNDDPVLEWRKYVVTPTTSFLLYNNQPRRTVAIQLDDDSPNSTRRLGGIYFNQAEVVSGYRRELDWSILPITGAITLDESWLAPYNATFTQGWRSVSGPTPFRHPQ